MEQPVKAPWTEDQVNSANEFQKAGIFHPYTCGKCRDDLVATPEGWKCSCGQWHQDWAEPMMLDWSWKELDWRKGTAFEKK